jgi:non-heme chloroperoxidase
MQGKRLTVQSLSHFHVPYGTSFVTLFGISLSKKADKEIPMRAIGLGRAIARRGRQTDPLNWSITTCRFQFPTDKFKQGLDPPHFQVSCRRRKRGSCTVRAENSSSAPGAAAALTFPMNSQASGSKQEIYFDKQRKPTMSTITTKDGTTIYYKDWGPKTGPVITFSHGWPLSSDAWESQMFFLASEGYRCVAHDRRGHGRSSQPWDGNHMDQYADDLAELFEKLDLKKAMMVGHSTGGGEVARYVGRHGTKRVSKAVLMGAVPPIMVRTKSNPGGLPMEVFDGFRKAYLADRAQFFLDVASGPFFNFNRPGAKVSQGLIQSWWMQGMMCGHKNGYDCIKAFSETDFTDDLKKIDVATLIVHGDDDQIVPIDASAKLSAKLVKNSVLKIYPGGSHSLGDTSREQLNKDLLEFIKS